MAVYFIMASESGPIKIGFADNPEKRLRELQTASPYRLRLLGVKPGTVSDERALHARFAQTRLHGEWFEPTDELLKFAASEMPVSVPSSWRREGRCTDCGLDYSRESEEDMRLHRKRCRAWFLCSSAMRQPLLHMAGRTDARIDAQGRLMGATRAKSEAGQVEAAEDWLFADFCESLYGHFYGEDWKRHPTFGFYIRMRADDSIGTDIIPVPALRRKHGPYIPGFMTDDSSLWYYEPRKQPKVAYQTMEDLIRARRAA